MVKENGWFNAELLCKVIKLPVIVYQKKVTFLPKNTGQHFKYRNNRSFFVKSTVKKVRKKTSEIEFKVDYNLLPENLDQIGAEKVDTLVDANKLHKMIESFVRQSQSHFVFDGFVTDHVELAQVNLSLRPKMQRFVWIAAYVLMSNFCETSKYSTVTCLNSADRNSVLLLFLIIIWVSRVQVVNFTSLLELKKCF